MRSLRKSWIGVVLVLLFGISLLFWKSSANFSNILNSDNVLAKIGSTPISTNKFNRTLQMNVQQFNQMLGKELTGEEIRNYKIHHLALNALVNDTVFENEFNELNFKLDEILIAKKTKNIIPELYNENNELDENNLNKFLQQQRLKIEDIVQIIHYDARAEYFNSTFLDIGFPSSFTNKIEAYNNHSRDIQYLKIPLELINIKKILKDNENELNNILFQFYEKNISQYMSDEKRDIEYIIFDKENFIRNFIPTNNDILEYYNTNFDLYFENEKRSFYQFNFKTLSEAEKFKKIIENIISFKEIETYSNQNSVGYNVFDNLSRDDILEEIAQSLFTLNVNQQSSVIKTPIAYHIILLKSIEPKRQLSLEEVRNDIIKTISNSDVNNFLIDLENQISQDILEGLNLKEISQKNDLKISFFNNITNSFDEFDEKNEPFFKSIIDNSFLANLNFTNDIVKLNQDKFYIYELKKITESQPLNLKDIKDNVLEDWKKFKRVEKIELLINNNKTNINLLKDLEKEFNQKIKNLSIKSTDRSIPSKLAIDVFKSDPGFIVYQVDENELHLSMLKKINIVEKSDKIKEKISLNNEIRNALYNELISKTKISINDQLLDAILNSY